jgi:hypothetical protein
MNVTVTHTIHPEVIELLKTIFSGTGAQPVMSGNKKTGTVKEITTPKKEETKPVVSETEGGDDSATTKVITLEELRQKFTSKVQNEKKREEMKALLAEFGADKLTSLKPEQYASFHEKMLAA